MIIYRRDKNAPLSADELDGNFRDLENRLKLLETRLTTPHLITAEQIDEEIFFKNHHNQVIGKFTMPTLKPWPQGPWKPLREYKFGHLITQPKQCYFCIKGHTSGSDFSQDKAAGYWEILIDMTPF